MIKKIFYLKRIFDAYILKKSSQLSFWHGKPSINEQAFMMNEERLQYYMPFTQKAEYDVFKDKNNIPLLDYHGKIGKQYNPIAIAQYGLGHVNLFLKTKKKIHKNIIDNIAKWFVDSLELNSYGIYVWHHKFDFEYARLLKNPWYSGLAQGQIISFLLRAFKICNNNSYAECAHKAVISLKKQVKEGGVIFEDKEGNLWIEEYITEPLMHILNGFIWAWWGVYDYCLYFNDPELALIRDKLLKTLETKLECYDTGFWSLYDLSDKKIDNLASPFYHFLHIVQLNIMYRLTKKEIFLLTANRWEGYNSKKLNKLRAFIIKSIFKLKYF